MVKDAVHVCQFDKSGKSYPEYKRVCAECGDAVKRNWRYPQQTVTILSSDDSVIFLVHNE